MALDYALIFAEMKKLTTQMKSGSDVEVTGCRASGSSIGANKVFDAMPTSELEEWRPPNRTLDVTIHKMDIKRGSSHQSVVSTVIHNGYTAPSSSSLKFPTDCVALFNPDDDISSRKDTVVQQITIEDTMQQIVARDDTANNPPTRCLMESHNSITSLIAPPTSPDSSLGSNKLGTTAPVDQFGLNVSIPSRYIHIPSSVPLSGVVLFTGATVINGAFEVFSGMASLCLVKPESLFATVVEQHTWPPPAISESASVPVGIQPSPWQSFYLAEKFFVEGYFRLYKKLPWPPPLEIRTNLFSESFEFYFRFDLFLCCGQTVVKPILPWPPPPAKQKNSCIWQFQMYGNFSLWHINGGLANGCCQVFTLSWHPCIHLHVKFIVSQHTLQVILVISAPGFLLWLTDAYWLLLPWPPPAVGEFLVFGTAENSSCTNRHENTMKKPTGRSERRAGGAVEHEAKKRRR